MPHAIPAPRRLSLAPARPRPGRPRRRLAWVLTLVALGLGLLVGGPGPGWYRSFRHYRWMQAARAALDRGDLATARGSARRVVGQNPAHLDAVRLLAEAALRAKARDAVYWQSRVVELEPDDPGNLLAWARTARDFEDLPTAVIALGRVPEESRHTAAYALAAADIAEAQGDVDLAARHIDAALALRAESVPLRLRLAQLQLRSSSEVVRSEGRATLDQLKADPRWRRRALSALAREAIGRRRIPEALAATRDLLAWGHTDAEEQLLHAEALQLGRTEEYQEHLRSLQSDAVQEGQPGRMTPARLIAWMGEHESRAAAIAWARTLPPETGRTRPTALAVARLQAQDEDWLGLRAWTKDPHWAEDEPLRLAYLSLALARGPSELRTPGAPESLWTRALESAAQDPARLEQIANWTLRWNLPSLAEPSWWALANAADDPNPALEELSRVYRQRTDARGRFRVARRRLELHPMDREAIAELAYLGLLLEIHEPDPQQLVDLLRRRPPLSSEGVRACALGLWRQDRLREALPLFDRLPVPSREDPGLAWFYGTLLANAGETSKAQRYLALGANHPRSPEEEDLFRSAPSRARRR